MTQAQRFTVRPFPSRLARADQKDAFRVLLSPSALLSLNLRAEEPCTLQLENGVKRTAIAWTAVERIQDTVVQATSTLQDLYGLKLGDRIVIARLDEPVPSAEIVILRDATGVDQLSEVDKRHWEWYLEHPLQKAGTVSAGMLFDKVELKGQKRMFIIRDVKSPSTSSLSTLFTFGTETQIRILDDTDFDATIPYTLQSFDLDGDGVGGLTKQLRAINGVLKRLLDEDPLLTLPSYYRANKGILLYGPKGTGKSLLTEKVSKLPWAKVLRITSGLSGQTKGESVLRNLFKEARQSQPSLVVIDQLDAIAANHTALDHQPSTSLASALLDGFESIKAEQVLVMAETRHPNHVDEKLRATGRLAMEIEVPVPTANQRLEILEAIRGLSQEPNDRLLQEVKDRTHGYVGADLFELLQRSVEIAEDRCLNSHDTPEHPVNRRSRSSDTDHTLDDNMSLAPTLRPMVFHIAKGDLDRALALIRPTAMQEIFIDTPNVRWSDIGGQGETKRQLRLAVQRPLTMAPLMDHLGIAPKKGVLLYGPPGCSKTLLAKALATESGLNFLPVKGAEIISMYVGESERAIREIFRKARAASPSIVFFDEIDSIAGSRMGKGSGNASLNVLTTLLNEIDGFEELKNVLVLAATNDPRSVDIALLRPGRFDNLIYVGLPEDDAREEIFKLWMGRSHTSRDVQLSTLVKGTAGHSGAEIVAICQTAGEMAMDRAADNALRTETVEITMREFLEAIRRTPRGVSSAVMASYELWRASIGVA